MPEISRLVLDADTAHAARLFLSSVTRNYAVRAAVLFGSRARGGFRSDSDADIRVWATLADAVLAVASQARQIRDQRIASAGERIEQGGFADVGSAD